MRLLLKILTALMLAYGSGYALRVSLNPEVVFWTEVIRKRDAETDILRQRGQNQSLLFFTGGSSCAFSVDPAIIGSMLGIPCMNLGLPVACGREYIVDQALRRCRAGDMLVLCLEPDTLCYASESPLPSPMAYALEAKLHNPVSAIPLSTAGPLSDTSGWLSIARPGVSYGITWLGRTITGKGYRYKPADIRPGGRVETPEKPEQYSLPGRKGIQSLAPDAREFLAHVAATASRKGVRIAYSFPWQLTRSEDLGANRESHKAVAAEISTFMPVIKDDSMGCVDNPDFFSDTIQHLTASGSTARSRELASALADWQTNQGRQKFPHNSQ